MVCRKPVQVKTPYGDTIELIPIKVWTLKPRGVPVVKIGLFRDPAGRYFRAKVPMDYPDC